MDEPVLTDEQVEKMILAALQFVGRDGLWAKLTHDSGPYEIAIVNADTLRLFKAFLAAAEPVIRADERERCAIPKERLALNVQHSDCHKAADAFWGYWNANGETHKRGYYESTWGAINSALRTVGVVKHEYPAAIRSLGAGSKEKPSA